MPAILGAWRRLSKRIAFIGGVEEYLTLVARLTVDIRDLELVEALADCRGLARAADRLHVSPSALSHQLRLLEERLGVPLFVRSPRHMTPTPAGERLMRAGLPVLRELRLAEDEIGVREAERRGVLRISVERYPSYEWLPPILKYFQDRFPKVDVRVAPERSHSPLEGLLDRSLDLALVLGQPHYDGIRTFPLFRSEMVAVMPEEHPLARKPFVASADLEAERTLAVPGDDTPGAASVTSRIPLIDLMIALVRHDLGIALLPSWVAQHALRSGGLAARRITRDGIFNDWSVAHRSDDVPGYVATFVEALFRRPPSEREMRHVIGPACPPSLFELRRGLAVALRAEAERPAPTYRGGRTLRQARAPALPVLRA
jgi:LysR family transcriptional regulator, regulator for metE and metH